MLVVSGVAKTLAALACLSVEIFQFLSDGHRHIVVVSIVLLKLEAL